MEKMFDPFEREKNSTLSGVQGTGLGLPIVKRFVELMEGTIEAISTEGVGTEFIIKTDFLLASRALLETTNRQSTVSCMLNQNTRKTYRRMYRIYTEEKRLPVKPGKMERELSS